MAYHFELGHVRGENQIEFDDLRIDAVAAWIIARMPEDMQMSFVRMLDNAYDKWCEEGGAYKAEPMRFIAVYGTGEHQGQRFECTISNRNEDHAFLHHLIQGSIHYSATRTEICANSLLLIGLPDAMASVIEPGRAATDIVDTQILEGRIVDDVKRADDSTLVSLKPIAPAKWSDIFPDWP